MILTILALVLGGVAVQAWRTNPSRRKNIDNNVRKIVSAKTPVTIEIEHASEKLEKEYNYQFKGYPGDLACYRDPENRNTLILARR